MRIGKIALKSSKEEQIKFKKEMREKGRLIDPSKTVIFLDEKCQGNLVALLIR